MRKLGSDYLEWAKLQGSAPYALTASGMPSRALAELGLPADKLARELQLSGVAAYGYEPLLRGLGALHGVDPGCVVTAAGTSMANHLAMAALISPGDEVLIERPTYEPLLALAQFLGARVTRFERVFEDQFRVNPQAIARALTPKTRLVVLTNLHNPSGVLTSEATLSEVGELARDAGARVLVDEAYLDAVFDEPVPVRTALHLGPTFVVTSSLTKVYGLSGLRCGWILAEPALAQKMWRLDDLFSNHDAFPALQLSVVALSRLGAWRMEVRQRLDAHRVLVEEFVAGRDELEVVRPRHGTILFPRLVGGDAAVAALCARLRARDGGVVPGHFFEAPGHFRIGIGVAPEILRGGLERLGQALDEGGGAGRKS
jgi:aspartate/methionine/tyrosine aminotransferase